MVEVPLKQLGVEVTTQNGYLPIQVKGPLKGGDCYVDGSVSSQFLTGLLMALPLATKDSTLFVTDLKSKPYIDMTLALLADFGIRITHDDYQKFSIQGNQKYKAQSYQIEGDWSGAAFLLVAGAIAGQVTVTNLSAYSTQADKAILQALQMAGAYLSIEANQVTVTHKPLSAFVFDATHCPDLFPPLVALAAHCKGTSVITGAKRLLHKESNRALSLSQEFGKMGIKIEVYGDQMQITGGEIQSADVHSHNDHRIAMACATATLFGSATVTIDAAEAINKSYPTFFDDLATISSK
jgi:3-phosphoshikimate 1-carboxyvinyltransferase